MCLTVRCCHHCPSWGLPLESSGSLQRCFQLSVLETPATENVLGFLLPHPSLAPAPVASRSKFFLLDHHPRPTLSLQHLSTLVRPSSHRSLRFLKGTYVSIVMLQHFIVVFLCQLHALLFPSRSLLGDRQLVSWLDRALLYFSGRRQHSSQWQLHGHDDCTETQDHVDSKAMCTLRYGR